MLEGASCKSTSRKPATFNPKQPLAVRIYTACLRIQDRKNSLKFGVNPTLGFVEGRLCANFDIHMDTVWEQVHITMGNPVIAVKASNGYQ